MLIFSSLRGSKIHEGKKIDAVSSFVTSPKVLIASSIRIYWDDKYKIHYLFNVVRIGNMSSTLLTHF